MDFARKQLEKYGWKEGEGLGKHRSGISKALKPKLKFDTGGLGHDVFEDINNTWWQRLYDEAAKNIVTKKDGNNSIYVETIDESIEITTKKQKSKKNKKPTKTYQNFVSSSELNYNVEKKLIDDRSDEEPEVKRMTRGICDLTDEELFKACGSLTAHKGARHGLRMNAKLARLEKQENDSNLNKDIIEPLKKKIMKSHKKKKEVM